MLRERKFFSFLLVLAMLFAVIVSGGCGGGGSSSGSYLIPPDDGGEYPDNPDNPVNPDIPTPEPDNPDNPVAINGTWTIESGSSVMNAFDDTWEPSYVSGKIKWVDIEMRKNDNDEYYTLIFSGYNVDNSGIPGDSKIEVDYQDGRFNMSGNFKGYSTFIYTGGNTYETTYNGVSGNGYRDDAIIVTLEDSNTLRLHIDSVGKDEDGDEYDGWYELILKRDSNVIVNGAWEVVSGSGEAVSGDEFATLTYETSDLDQIGVTLRKNDSDESYSVHLYGDSINNDGFIVTFKTEGNISDFGMDEHQQLPFIGFNDLESASNNSYEHTETEENRYGMFVTRKFSFILDDANTLRFRITMKTESDNLNIALWYEIILKKDN